MLPFILTNTMMWYFCDLKSTSGFSDVDAKVFHVEPSNLSWYHHNFKPLLLTFASLIISQVLLYTQLLPKYRHCYIPQKCSTDKVCVYIEICTANPCSFCKLNPHWSFDVNYFSYYYYYKAWNWNTLTVCMNKPLVLYINVSNWSSFADVVIFLALTYCQQIPCFSMLSMPVLMLAVVCWCTFSHIFIITQAFEVSLPFQ